MLAKNEGYKVQLLKIQILPVYVVGQASALVVKTPDDLNACVSPKFTC